MSAIQAYQADHPAEPGGRVPIPGDDGASQVLTIILPPSSSPSLAQLQRLRRQFITMSRQQPAILTLQQSRIQGLFVDYLNDRFENAT